MMARMLLSAFASFSSNSPISFLRSRILRQKLRRRGRAGHSADVLQQSWARFQRSEYGLLSREVWTAYQYGPKKMRASRTTPQTADKTATTMLSLVVSCAGVGSTDWLRNSDGPVFLRGHGAGDPWSAGLARDQGLSRITLTWSGSGDPILREQGMEP